MRWITGPLRRTTDWRGRSRGREYWLFQIGVLGLIAAIYVLFAMLIGFDGAGDAHLIARRILLAVIVIIALGQILPLMALQVRRFHDQNLSGWWLLLYFLPYVGGLVVLFFMCRPGTAGPNRFGPQPA